MVTIRSSLLFLSCLALLGACAPFLEFPPCPPPGAIGQKTCYYNLTITNKGSDPIVMAKVAKGVIDENRIRKSKLGFFEFSDYQVDDYPFFEYTFPVTMGFNDLVIGQDAWFESVPGKPELKKLQFRLIVLSPRGEDRSID